jgi:type II secretion system protein N
MPTPLSALFAGIATSTTPDGARHFHATRHAVSLDALPFRTWIGLPVTGALELDVDLTAPVDRAQSHGTVAVRTTQRCRVGDDATPIKHPQLDALMPGGFPFTHLDVESLAADVTVADGVARLTRLALASPDLELHLDLAVTLVTELVRSTVDGLLRFRFTDAFAEREPILTGMLSLFNLSRDPAGLASIPFAGPITSPRITRPR